MNVNIDPDTSPDTYIEHRELVRIADVGSTEPAAPTRIRIGSSTGAMVEADVDVWLGGGLPPMTPGFMKDFTTRYLDPTEVYARFRELQAEFPNISELIALPYATNGYQRRAQATMAGTTMPGNSLSGATAQSQAVVLTSRAWGHEGGNDITAEFRNPGVPSSALSVTVSGKDILVNLATDAAGALSSTVAGRLGDQRDPVASTLVVALTYRGNAGAGIVQPGKRSTCRTSCRCRRTPTSPAGRSSTSSCGSGRCATARRSACSLLPAARAGMGDAVDMPETPEQLLATTQSIRERSWSTTSTSSSSRRRTPTAPTTRCTTSTPSARR